MRRHRLVKSREFDIIHLHTFNPITDWLAVLGSGFKREDAPYLNNANPQALKAKDVNTRDVWGFRGAALIKPADNFRLVLSALRQKTDAMNRAAANTSPAPMVPPSRYRSQASKAPLSR